MSEIKPANTEPVSIVLVGLSAAAEQQVRAAIPKKLGRQIRKMTIVDGGYDAEAHTVTFALSSDTPVDRGYCIEILSHDKSAIRQERLKNGIPMLFNHDMDKHLGVSTAYEIDGSVLRITCVFGPNPRAQEKEADVAARILKDVSVGYVVHEWEITEDNKGNRTMLATDWEPLEGSLVTVPADPTVGIGRSFGDEVPVKYKLRRLDEPAKRSADSEDDEDDEEEDEDEDEENTGSERTTTPAAQRTSVMAEIAVGTDLAAQNNTRVEGLRSLHARYPNEFNAASLKTAEDLGYSLERANNDVASAVIASNQRSNVTTIGDDVVARMSERELRSYSLRDAYAAAVNANGRTDTFADKAATSFASEVSQDMRKVAGELDIPVGSGILIPSVVSSRARALAAAQKRTISAGGNFGQATNFTNVSAAVIELLRPQIAILALGAQWMSGLKGKYQMPRQNAAGSSNWVLEGGAGAGPSNPGFDDIVMSPNRLTMQQDYYRDQFAQSAVAIDPILDQDRFQGLQRALDYAALAGSGNAPVPKGLFNYVGIAGVLSGSTRAASGAVTAGAGGVPMTYVDYNNMEAAIATNSGDISTMRWLTTPRVKAAGRSTPKTPGTNSDYVWPDAAKGLNGLSTGPLGYDALTTSLPYLTGFTANSVNNLHAVILGVWDQLLIGDWGLSEIIVDNITGAAQAKVTITEHAFYDINVRHVESFCACTSALPS